MGESGPVAGEGESGGSGRGPRRLNPGGCQRSRPEGETLPRLGVARRRPCSPLVPGRGFPRLLQADDEKKGEDAAPARPAASALGRFGAGRCWALPPRAARVSAVGKGAGRETSSPPLAFFCSS